MKHDKLRSPYARMFACVNSGDWCVTQGAWDYCQQHGCATYTVDNQVQGHCPRCGTHKVPQ